MVCTKLLIDSQADVNLAMHPDAADDEGGFTPLIAAAKNGHAQCARVMIEAGAAVDAADNEGMTALLWAGKNGHEPCARIVIEAKVALEKQTLKN